MDCGEQCVVITMIVTLLKSCADNWGTVSTQEEVSSVIRKRIAYVTRSQMLPVWQLIFSLS